MKIYITGVSGTGKTSLARALKERNINAVDIDEISHWENKMSGERTGWEPASTNEWNEAHQWVCDISRMKEMLSKTEDAVALGHASNQEEYLPFFDKVFTIKCSAETIIARLKARTDNDFGKHPLDQARILEWHKGFDDWMISKGANILDGERTLEEIANEIASNFPEQ